MRIGIEAQRIFRSNSYGMDIVAIELIKALQKIDRDNQYFIFCRPGSKSVQEVFPNLQPNFKIIEFSGGDYVFWEQFRLPKKVKQYELDLLHCTANTAPLKLSVPLYLILHDVIYLESINLDKGTWYQRLGNLYRRWIVPRIVPKAALIGTVSHYERNNIINELSVPDEKIKVFHNAVGKHFRQYSSDEKVNVDVNRKYHLPEEYFLFFYNTDPRKNFKNVIRAYIDYRNNGGDKALCILNANKRVVVSCLKSNGGKDYLKNVHCIGYVNNSELVAFYNAAKVFLFLSTRESFGIPVLEAMACGTPVICSNLSSIPEVAGEAALLVGPEAIKEISSSMELLMENQLLCAELSAKGLERVHNFSWENTARKWIDNYHALKE